MKGILVYQPPDKPAQLPEFIDSLDPRLREKIIMQLYQLSKPHKPELRGPHFKRFSLERYLSINGRIREQIYTYYNRVTPSGAVKEIPAYCVNPNDKGVPQTVGVGESIKYLADEKAADPKVTGIIANGYPNRGLSELGLENK